MPDEPNEPNEQSEKTPKGKRFLGILVILIAVGGTALIFTSGQDWSTPYITGGGGNQNPLVGIPNAAIFFGESVGRIFVLLAGGILLVIAAIGFVIWRTSSRPWRTVARLSAFVFVVTAVVATISTVSDNKLEREKTHAKNVLRGNNMNEWGQPHAPGPFVDYYDSGEKAVEGQYDVNQKMSGLWTVWRETGEVRWEATYADGLKDGMSKSWTPGHVGPDEMEYRSGQNLHAKIYFADGQMMQESNSTFGEDGKLHDSTTEWYESRQVRVQWIHIDGQLHSVNEWYENGQKLSEVIISDRRDRVLIDRRWTLSGVEVPCVEGVDSILSCTRIYTN